MLREAQAVGAGALERTMFASAVDLSAATNEYLVAGHPPRKQELGRRVALVARYACVPHPLQFFINSMILL